MFTIVSSKKDQYLAILPRTLDLDWRPRLCCWLAWLDPVLLTSGSWSAHLWRKTRRRETLSPTRSCLRGWRSHCEWHSATKVKYELSQININRRSRSIYYLHHSVMGFGKILTLDFLVCLCLVRCWKESEDRSSESELSFCDLDLDERWSFLLCDADGLCLGVGSNGLM